MGKAPPLGELSAAGRLKGRLVRRSGPIIGRPPSGAPPAGTDTHIGPYGLNETKP